MHHCNLYEEKEEKSWGLIWKKQEVFHNFHPKKLFKHSILFLNITLPYI